MEIVSMKRVYQIGTAVLMALGILAFQNCGQSRPAVEGSPANFAKVSSDDIESRYDDIKEIASQNVSCSSDDDCIAVGVGGRNCGLPSEYVVTSKDNNLYGIEKLNEELASLETQYMAENDLVAACGAQEPPAVACVSNQCALR